MSLRRFFRLLLHNPRDHRSGVDDSLAKTTKDVGIATSTRGAGGGFSGTSKVYKHIGEGHENYAKSFKKKDG